MSRYIVHAITNGTKIAVQAPGRTPDRALWNIQRKREYRNAHIYLVFDRKTGLIVSAVQGTRQRF